MKSLSHFFLSILIAASILMTISCKKGGGNNTPPGGDAAGVYLAGRGDGEPSLPCYWNGDQAQTDLNAPFGGDAFAIQVSGSNIYVGGRAYTSNAQTEYLPCFWKNGTRQDLPGFRPNSVGIVKGISTGNGIVYGAGYCSDSLISPLNMWVYRPCIWKSNENKPMTLEVLYADPNDGWSGQAEAIATVSNSNKTGYVVAGSSTGEEGFTDPCYWTVGMAAAEVPNQTIDPYALSTMGYGGAALAVGASLDPKFGGDLSQTELIFAGFVYDDDEYNVPCYWYQGNRTNLSRISNTEHGAATAIHFNGIDVYVGGYTHNNTGQQIPCYWKNGNRTDLSLPAGAFGGKVVSVLKTKDDLYVGGSVSTGGGEIPCYWKNGEVVQFNKHGIVYAMALGN